MSTGGSSGSPRADAKMVEDAQRALVAFSGVPAAAVSGEAGAETEVRASVATNASTRGSPAPPRYRAVVSAPPISPRRST